MWRKKQDGESPRTRPTRPDPSRKPLIEPFKVGDKVLIEATVENIGTEGRIFVEFQSRTGATHCATLSPHQLKLSTDVANGEK